MTRAGSRLVIVVRAALCAGLAAVACSSTATTKVRDGDGGAGASGTAGGASGAASGGAGGAGGTSTGGAGGGGSGGTATGGAAGSASGGSAGTASGGGAGADGGACTPGADLCASQTCEAVAMYAGQDRPSAIVMLGESLYWIVRSGAGTALVSGDRSGACAPVLAPTLFEGGVAGDLIVDDDAVYAASTYAPSQVVRVDRQSGAVVTLLGPGDCANVGTGVLSQTVDALFAHCADGMGKIVKIDKSTRAVTTFFAPTQFTLAPFGLAMDGTTAYFAIGALEAYTLGGAANGVTIDGTSGYVAVAARNGTAWGITGSDIVSIASGGVRDVYAGVLLDGTRIGVDAMGAYAIGKGAGDGVGLVIAVDTLGTVISLAREVGRPGGVTGSATRIYFTDTLAGTVNQVGRP